MPRNLTAAILLAMATLLVGCMSDPMASAPIGPSDGWRIFRPLPGGYDLHAVWGESPSSIWAVGHGGVIVHWDGRDPVRIDSPTTTTLTTMDGRARDDIYAAGGSVVVHYDGHVWNTYDRFPNHTVESILCTADGRLLLGGTFGVRIGVAADWKTIDGPTSRTSTVWEGPDGRVRAGEDAKIWLVENDVATPEQDLAGKSIVAGNGRYLLAEDVGGADYIYRYHETSGWTVMVTGYSSTRAMIDFDGVVWSSNGGISYRDSSQLRTIWDNDGGRWIYGFARCGSASLVACGYRGTLLTATRNGDGFDVNETAQGIGYGHVNAIDGTGCNNIWAGEYWGRVLHFDGAVWTREFSQLPGDDKVGGIQALPDGQVVARGGDQIALRNGAGIWNRLPSPGVPLHGVFALSADSLFAVVGSNVRLWNGRMWTDTGLSDGVGTSFAATASGTLYALATGPPVALWQWNGESFHAVATLPLVERGPVCGSRSGETIWIAGSTNTAPYRTVVYRYERGLLQEVSAGVTIPPWPRSLTELRKDDLFVLVWDQVWRFHDGRWLRETGLPVEDYVTMWSHPDCGVLVQGHPMYFKEFPRE